MIKFVCIDKENKIIIIYAKNFAEAQIKADSKGWKLQGKFVEEHD